MGSHHREALSYLSSNSCLYSQKDRLLPFEFYTIALRVIAIILFKDDETGDKKDTCWWNTKSPGSASNPRCFVSYDLSC